jgi:ribonucleoside-diphosphate reductase alpha chain
MVSKYWLLSFKFYPDNLHIQGTPMIKNDERDNLLTPFGIYTLTDRYLLPGEGPQDLFVRISTAYADDEAHAQRLYDYMSQQWFMPSTPILSNGGTNRGLPISCFLNECEDSLESIDGLWRENTWLAAKGGGIGSYWGNVRGIGEVVGANGKTSGIVPFIKVMDSQTLAISQGSLRRGSAAVYLPVWHPEIEEFIEIRRPTGGDPNRRCLNIHHGILINDDFMFAVENNLPWKLRSPKTNEVTATVQARDLWTRILIARIETGEPYIIYIDHVNKAIPDWHKQAGLRVKTSNLCAEITLPTNKDRTAVCCLSSLNLETYLQWKDDPVFIEDVMRFLDNVLEDFIKRAPPSMAKAVYSASCERSVGLGVMGFHSFLQQQGVAFESATAKSWNKNIFKHIQEKSHEASLKLGKERGACPDAMANGYPNRFSNTTAVAPTASISIICGGSSPGIEPLVGNAYTHKTLSGSFAVRNKHLEKVLTNYGMNTSKVWSSIIQNEGSVQHLPNLTDHEKEVFKTAFEIDQRWIVEHAADRAGLIDQAQSVNLFFPANVHKKTLHTVHTLAWKRGVKSLYYCRSRSIARAEKTDDNAVATQKAPAQVDTEECLACQ